MLKLLSEEATFDCNVKEANLSLFQLIVSVGPARPPQAGGVF
jgi:hypothetical protein